MRRRRKTLWQKRPTKDCHFPVDVERKGGIGDERRDKMNGEETSRGDTDEGNK